MNPWKEEFLAMILYRRELLSLESNEQILAAKLGLFKLSIVFVETVI